MKILFIFAHPDDEAYGPAGTIAKLVKEGHSVFISSLCIGDRPGSETVSKSRGEAFSESCKKLGVKDYSILGYHDAKLTIEDSIKAVEKEVKKYKPDIVYTHNISDLHRDHRLVAEAAMVACRPKPNSTVKKLYMCEIPSSTDWTFGELDPVFVPNVYTDVSSAIHTKVQVMGFYSTEIYNYPDARSVESMECLAMYRGKQIGVHRAEAFKLVFSIE